MKITDAVFAISVISCSTCGAMTENNFVSVTNDWYHGAYTNVYLLAQHREAQNSNDIVAAYIKYEWNMILGTKASFSNAIEKVLQTSGLITNELFACEYAITYDGLIHMRDNVIPSVSEERVEADRRKLQYSGKRFTEWRILKILWDQRLW